MAKKVYANDPQGSKYQKPRKASGDALMNTAGTLLGAGAAFVAGNYYSMAKDQAKLMKDGKGHKVSYRKKINTKKVRKPNLFD